MKRSELFFNLLLIPVDLIAIVLGFYFAYYTRLNFGPFNVIYLPSLRDYILFVSYFLPLWIFVFSFMKLYSIKIVRRGTLEFHRILIATPTALMLSVTIMFFIKEDFFSRLIILYSLIFITLFVLILRLLVISTQRFLYRYGIGVKRIIIIGINDIGKNIIEGIEKYPQRGFVILGIIKTNDNSNNIDKHKILGEIKDIGSVITKLNPDEIFQTDSELTTKEQLNIIHLCEDKKVTFRFVPSMLGLYAKNNLMETFSQIPVFEIQKSRLEGWNRIIKRFVDITGALIGIILTSPVQIALAIIIKSTSKGPIFYKQERVGRDKNFNILKFRTMHTDADKRHKEFIKKHGNMFKLKNDPRLTKIGGFLRKTSLDEIPQFYNVFLGNMSLVGPRPPMPIETERYTRQERKRIGRVKPGITGLWQVSGRSDISFDEWVKLDVYYIENWSLILDFGILFKTFWVLINRRGAY